MSSGTPGLYGPVMIGAEQHAAEQRANPALNPMSVYGPLLTGETPNESAPAAPSASPPNDAAPTDAPPNDAPPPVDEQLAALTALEGTDYNVLRAAAKAAGLAFEGVPRKPELVAALTAAGVSAAQAAALSAGPAE